nr:hypothetical protein [Nereida sp. MMG025]
MSEVFAGAAADASALGFVLSQLPEKDAPILWVQDRVTRLESGVPYLHGMSNVTLIQISVSRAQDALWALEEGLRSSALRAVVGEIWGDPKALSFTATKRLAMRAEASGVPCWLVRRAAAANLSAARDRWRLNSLPSAPNPHDSHAPGDARWQADLFRTRRGKPTQWVATHERATDRVYLSAASVDQQMATGDGAHRQRAAR